MNTNSKIHIHIVDQCVYVNERTYEIKQLQERYEELFHHGDWFH